MNKLSGVQIGDFLVGFRKTGWPEKELFVVLAVTADENHLHVKVRASLEPEVNTYLHWLGAEYEDLRDKSLFDVIVHPGNIHCRSFVKWGGWGSPEAMLEGISREDAELFEE